MKNFDHKHIVKYYTFKEEATFIKTSGKEARVAYIAQEPVLGGELFDYVAIGGAFSEKICRYYFNQLLQGLFHLHKAGYSHRDLKPSNILLDSNFDIKIVDFGFAAPLAGRQEDGLHRSLVGTPAFMAPEILFRQPYNG